MKNEHELSDIVTKVNEELQRFEEKRNGLGNVVLLIGKTGSGKSTLFNLLLGATFKQKEGIRKFELDLQLDQDKFSLMKSGCKSVTKFPKCFYEENYQHLVVDFPGFSDTNGWVDEVVIQSLYNKITKKSNLKIAFVNYQPYEEIPNRGADLQEYLKSVISQDSVKLDKITLLMNKYSGRTNEEQLIVDLQEQLTEHFKQKAGKIIIQRAVKKADDLKNLSKEQREKIWKELVQTPIVQLSPYQFKNRDVISSYLIESFDLLFFQVFHEFDQKLSTIKLTIEQVQLLVQKLTIVQQLLKGQIVNEWMDQYLAILQEIQNILSFKTQLKFNNTNIQNFKQIYHFFFDFQEQLDGYTQINHTQNKIIRNCNTTIQNLNNTLEQLKKVQEVERQKRQAEQQKLELERQKQELEKKKLEDEKLKQEAEKKKKEAENREQQEREKAQQERRLAEQKQQEQQQLFMQNMMKLQADSDAKAKAFAEKQQELLEELRDQRNEKARQERENQNKLIALQEEMLEKENQLIEQNIKQAEQQAQQEAKEFQKLKQQIEMKIEKSKEKQSGDAERAELESRLKCEAENQAILAKQRRQEAEELARIQEQKRVEAEKKASQWSLFNTFKKASQIVIGTAQTAVGAAATTITGSLALVTGSETLKSTTEYLCETTSNGINNIEEALNLAY